MILEYGFSVVVGKRRYYQVSSLEIQGDKTFSTVRGSGWPMLNSETPTLRRSILTMRSWASAIRYCERYWMFAARPRVQMSAGKRLQTKYPMYLDDGTVV